ncbi:hypothetical protein THAOC_13061 [Thalassiosira oceanica]|uniref:Uncharacterized protein n=1 Tax=Thalassiosira oceanica TaxID=159749 RepID=K0SM42_THAOC|nr:hypothetical protein THAOC_13061 [Thalassiosira oceanica]|eukprot:EJK66039.1 hypothetical protein THAOC_13061 [Thalassiosira oceanica]
MTPNHKSSQAARCLLLLSTTGDMILKPDISIPGVGDSFGMHMSTEESPDGSMVEHLSSEQKAVGSSPTSGAFCSNRASIWMVESCFEVGFGSGRELLSDGEVCDVPKSSHGAAPTSGWVSGELMGQTGTPSTASGVSPKIIFRDAFEAFT